MVALGMKQKLARLSGAAPPSVMAGLGRSPGRAPSKPSESAGACASVDTQRALPIPGPISSAGAGSIPSSIASDGRPGPSALRAMLEALAERHAQRLAEERLRARPLASAHATLRAAREAPTADEVSYSACRTAAAWPCSAAEHGLRILRYELEPDHHHGRISLASGLTADPRALADLALDPSMANVDPSRVLFLDTETTGLSLGGGTVPFLVGMAYAVDGAIVVEQMFLDSLAGEAALLARLRERVEASSALVTYNGKSFDWPLLTTRYVLNRVEPPATRPHLDLLTLARRVYRARLGSVRLVQMEVEVLGHRRDRDIAGAEIPGTYWSYQRHGQPEAVWPILEHNIQDLLALAALQGELSERYRTIRMEDDPTDQWARARVAFRAHAFDRALSFAEAALDGGATSEVAGRAALLAADVHRKAGRYSAAAQLLEDSLVDLSPRTLEMAQVRLALAKLWEHRLKDPERALYHAQATDLAEGRDFGERRRARLQKRIARRAAAPYPSASRVKNQPRSVSQSSRGAKTRDSA